jgi:hypothetical protein
LHLILADWLLPVQSSAAADGLNTDRMQSDVMQAAWVSDMLLDAGGGILSV